MKNNYSENQSQTDILVGLFAFQGDYEAHGRAVERLGRDVLEVRTSSDLEKCTHLIIPGGETTTYLKLLEYHDLRGPIERHIELGRPIFATCAGLILLAREVRNPSQDSLNLLDIVIERNSYGRQVDSFEVDLEIPFINDKPHRGVFIRAPRIISVGESVEVLSMYEGDPVLVRQGKILGAAFHPELTEDTRIHEYFLSLDQ